MNKRQRKKLTDRRGPFGLYRSPKAARRAKRAQEAYVRLVARVMVWQSENVSPILKAMRERIPVSGQKGAFLGRISG